MNNVLIHNTGRTAEERDALEIEERERINAIALEAQTVRFAVAPKQAITTATRGIVEEGGEVTYDDFRNTQTLADGTVLELNAPEVTMGSLIARGLVLEKAVH